MRWPRYKGARNRGSTAHRAIDEEVGFQTLAGSGLNGGNVSVFMHVDAGHVIQVGCHAPRGGECIQIICKLQRIHMKGIDERDSRVHFFGHFWRKAHFTKYGLCRYGIHKGHRLVAHQPSSAGVIDRPRCIPAERVMIKPAIVFNPVHVTDRLFEGTVNRLHEIQFIDADDGQRLVDTGNSGFTNADSWHIR